MVGLLYKFNLLHFCINFYRQDNYFKMEGAAERHKNKNKHVTCGICSRSIHSDNCKCHSRAHKDILSMLEEKKELRAKHLVQLQRKVKEGILVAGCEEIVEAPLFNEEDLETDLLKKQSALS